MWRGWAASSPGHAIRADSGPATTRRTRHRNARSSPAATGERVTPGRPRFDRGDPGSTLRARIPVRREGAQHGARLGWDAAVRARPGIASERRPGHHLRVGHLARPPRRDHRRPTSGRSCSSSSRRRASSRKTSFASRCSSEPSRCPRSSAASCSGCRRPRGAPGRAAIATILRGYPLTAVLAVLLVFLAVLAVWRRVRSVLRGRTDAHVPMMVKQGAYDQVATDVDTALSAGGDGPRTWSSAGGDVDAGKVAGRGRRPRRGRPRPRPSSPAPWAATSTSWSTRATCSISGKPEDVARARAAIASRLVTSSAYMTVTAEAQAIEDRIAVLAQAGATDEGPPPFDAAARRELAAIDTQLAATKVPYEEWEVLYRKRLQVERDLRARLDVGQSRPRQRGPGAGAAPVRSRPPPGSASWSTSSAGAIVDAATDEETQKTLDKVAGRRWRVGVAAMSVVVAALRAILAGRASSGPDADGDAVRGAGVVPAAGRSAADAASVEVPARDPGRGRHPAGGVAASDTIGHQPLDLGLAGRQRLAAASSSRPLTPASSPTCRRSVPGPRPDDEHELTARRDPTVGGRLGKLAERPPHDLLVDLGQLAADRARSIGTARRGQVAQAGRHPARRLEHDRPAVVGRDPGEPLAPLAPRPRQEPLERPARPGDARSRRPRPARPTAPGSARPCRPRSPMPRPGRARDRSPPACPASVTSARSAPPRRCSSSAVGPRRLALGVVARHPGRDPVARQQPVRVPRVLGRDERHGPQDLERPERDVAEVADRRGDDVQRPAGARPIPVPAPLPGHPPRADPGRRRGYR